MRRLLPLLRLLETLPRLRRRPMPRRPRAKPRPRSLLLLLLRRLPMALPRYRRPRRPTTAPPLPLLRLPRPRPTARPRPPRPRRLARALPRPPPLPLRPRRPTKAPPLPLLRLPQPRPTARPPRPRRRRPTAKPTRKRLERAPLLIPRLERGLERALLLLLRPRAWRGCGGPAVCEEWPCTKRPRRVQHQCLGRKAEGACHVVLLAWCLVYKAPWSSSRVDDDDDEYNRARWDNFDLPPTLVESRRSRRLIFGK